ncbi:MAG: hypothetical protein EAZ53_07475 [Bacteroidetes bacterium]|nr:MAG: hypothetical protein EAZ53_07475 [Bacteroidota bacterium]
MSKKKITNSTTILNHDLELNNQDNKLSFIVFDKKVVAFISICLTCFVILTFFKIHGSSTGIWDKITGNVASKSNVIFGTPKVIRSDEWLLHIPFLMSQYNNGFPKINESWGDGNAPIFMGGPTNDLISHLKINNLGLFLLDIERGYAFLWNFKSCFLLISALLFFLIMTKNDFWLSFLGSFWIYLSSGTQWWFSTGLPEYITSAFFIIVGIVYMFFSIKTFHIALASILVLVFSWVLVFFVYPPFQLVTLYIIIFSIISIFIKYWNIEVFKTGIWYKFSFLFLIILTNLYCLFDFYDNTKEVIEVVSNTIYPGKRVVSHGNLTLSRFFIGYFDSFFLESKYPSLDGYFNICEGSGYILLFPFIIPQLIIGFIKNKKPDYTYLFLFGLICMLGLICIFKIPDFFTKITLLNMVSSVRSHMFLGLVGVIVFIYFLSDKNIYILNTTQKVVYLIFVLVFYFVLYQNIKPIISPFITKTQFFLVGLMIFSLAWLIISNFKYRIIIIGSIILLYHLPNININPTSAGLSPFLSNSFYKYIKEFNKDKDVKWVVFGQMQFSNYIKSTGAKVISGVNYAPMKEKLAILDPKNQFKHIHNRYAHISFYPFITGTDSVAFVYDGNIYTDNYTIAMDPCSPRLKKLGVTHFLFTYQPQPVEVRELKLVSNNGVYIYKREL